MAKDAYYFSHDSNASQDPKILQMRSVYGAEGYGWYWMLIEMMREQEDYRLPVSGKYALNAYAMHMQCDCIKLASFIEDCVTEFGLFSKDENCIWSESLTRRMGMADEKSEKAKKAANARWEKRERRKPSNSKGVSDCANADAMQTQCGCNADASKNDAIKEKKGNEIKGKEKKEKIRVCAREEDDLGGVFRTFEDCGFQITGYTAEELMTLSGEYPDEWVSEAIRRAADQGKRTLAYVKGILNRWQVAGAMDDPKRSPPAGGSVSFLDV